MPARTEPTTTMATNKTKTSAKRFELPVLDFKFTSLTEGTGIPPPLPSPVEEKALKNEPGAKKEEASTNGKSAISKANGTQHDSSNADPVSPSHALSRGHLKRAAEGIPASPALSRPGSIRRLFSRSLLNTAYANAEVENGRLDNSSNVALASGLIRPESRSTGSIMDERKAKRSSGWFRRLRGSASGSSTGSSNGSVSGDSPSSKRMSMLLEVTKPAGPPPPMIPELGELESKVNLDEGSLGNDLFKNIK